MAKLEQLELIKRDVSEWNKWRDSNPEELIDLSGVDLSGADLSGANFSKADLSGADLRYTKLQGANLSQCKLEKVDLFKSNLQNALLSEANLMDASFAEANLNYAELRKANLRKASFSNSHLEDAQLNEADLTEAELSTEYFNENTSLYRANLTRANLRASKNYILNETLIEKTIFNPFSQEPWLVLRRTYTGIMFSIIIFATLVFFSSFVGKALFWASINSSQSAILELQSNIIESIDQVPDLTGNSINKLIFDDLTKDQSLSDDYKLQIWNKFKNWLSQILHKKKILLIEKINSIEPCLQSNCKKINVALILLGYKNSTFKSISSILFSSSLILYNLVRGGMTVYISKLSEEQKVSGYSPPRDAYIDQINLWNIPFQPTCFWIHKKVINPLTILAIISGSIFFGNFIYFLFTKSIYIPV